MPLTRFPLAPVNKDRSIRDVYGSYHDQDIDLDPDYQRNESIHPLSWKQSIITSVFVSKDIPAMYFHHRTVDNRLVKENLDGKQRLKALFDFMDDKFAYTLDDVPEIKNKKYSEMPADLKQEFDDFSLSIKTYQYTLTDEQIEYFFDKCNETKSTSQGELLHSLLSSGVRNGIATMYNHNEDIKAHIDFIVPNNKRNDVYTNIGMMAYMLKHNTLKEPNNTQLKKWFAEETQYTLDDQKRLRKYIPQVATLIDAIPFPRRTIRTSKTTLCAVLWFCVKHDDRDKSLMHQHAQDFQMPTSGVHTLQRYEAMRAFVEGLKAAAA